MGKIEQNKKRKRQAILVAAQDIFLSDGYVLASMDRVAAQAQITKQTLYRYFPSKIELFQDTLKYMGNKQGEGFFDHLQNPDANAGLLDFARDFIHFHLTDEHIATFRLLVAESVRAPELTRSFMSAGPDETDARLKAFFIERLGIEEPETLISLWTGMLLSIRSGVLVGMKKPGKKQIDQHAHDTVDFLLAATGKG